MLVHPFERQPHKMVKHTQTIRRQQPTNCLSVFGHFVGLELKGLTRYIDYDYHGNFSVHFGSKKYCYIDLFPFRRFLFQKRI